jgi:hypothetical protein
MNGMPADGSALYNWRLLLPCFAVEASGTTPTHSPLETAAFLKSLFTIPVRGLPFRQSF